MAVTRRFVTLFGIATLATVALIIYSKSENWFVGTHWVRVHLRLFHWWSLFPSELKAVELREFISWFSDKRPVHLTKLISDSAFSLTKFEWSLVTNSLNALQVGLFAAPHMLGYDQNRAEVTVFSGYRTGDHLTRTSLTYKVQPPILISVEEVQEPQKVHIVVGVRHRRTRLILFLQHILEKLFPLDNGFALHIMYSASEETENKNFLQKKNFHQDSLTSAEAKQLVHSVLEDVPHLEWTFEVEHECSYENEGFSRGCTFNRALEGLTLDSLVLLCDIDVFILGEMLQRCRSNTQLNHKAYFPILFSKYNPGGSFAKQWWDGEEPQHEDSRNYRKPESITVDAKSGLWRSFGYGMSCLYNDDIRRAGGIYESSGWGGEDNKLFENLLQLNNMEILRGAEPGLYHLYHFKNCENSDGLVHVHKDFYPGCLQSKVQLEGSQLTLAKEFFNITV